MTQPLSKREILFTIGNNIFFYSSSIHLLNKDRQKLNSHMYVPSADGSVQHKIHEVLYSFVPFQRSLSYYAPRSFLLYSWNII